MSRVFNTSFELSLRVLILLSVIDRPSSADGLAAMDFITTYGKSFQISDTNLNGDNDLKFSEYTSRRTLIKAALVDLFRKGMIMPSDTSEGFKYEITERGREHVLLLDGEYACQYKIFAKHSCAYALNKTEQMLITDINQRAAKALRRVTINE
jgi:hypothetical protein